MSIMTGDENGNLNLTKNVTRAEFARMLVAASTYKDKVSAVSNSSPFKDVPYTHWAAGYIKTAVQQGWLNGYLDGSYHPDQTITLEEAETGVLKLLGYGTSDFSGAYPYGQLALARSLNLNEKVTATQGGTMTRQNMMYLFYNLLSADTKDGQQYMTVLGIPQVPMTTLTIYRSFPIPWRPICRGKQTIRSRTSIQQCSGLPQRISLFCGRNSEI